MLISVMLSSKEFRKSSNYTNSTYSDQYPGSSIAELNREINTCLSENFEQSFSCDGHPMWSIRSEIQVRTYFFRM